MRFFEAMFEFTRRLCVTGLSMVNATSVLGAALVTWGHADGVVRVKLKKEQPPWPVVKSPGLDPVYYPL
jgi:hypothetical protein